MKAIDPTRRVVTHVTGRRREEYSLLASRWLKTPAGVHIPPGSRRRQLDLRWKIDRYLNELKSKKYE
jgi:hypothetical protein